MNRWRQLFDACDVVSEPWPGYRFVLKPTDESLSECEQEIGLALPRSYKEFMLLFGAGMLGSHGIAGPIGEPRGLDLMTLNREMHEVPDEPLLDRFGPTEEMAQYLFFCSSEFGEFYGWKTDEVTSENYAEYMIYEFPEHPTLRPVARDFKEFAFGVVLRPNDGVTPEWVFVPAQVEAP